MNPRRFTVALSFPGEKRDFIREVAEVLAAAIGKGKVLYDDYLTPELARPNLDLYLSKLYREDSELLVPFYCADYERKQWCRLEWRQMRDILLQVEEERIMPFRFDDAAIPGVLAIDGYVKIGARAPEDVAKLILERRSIHLAATLNAWQAKLADLRHQDEGELGQAEKLTLARQIEEAQQRIKSLGDEPGAGEHAFTQLRFTRPLQATAKRSRRARKTVAAGSDESHTVIGIEFVVEGPLSDFDAAEWQAELRSLLGRDVSKVRIASIRRGSLIVRVLGDPEVIAKAFEKLQSSSQTSQDFQESTGLQSYSGVLSSKASEQIFGRSEELASLDLAWAEHKINVLSVVGFGGVGKSHLIAYWLNHLAADGWRGAERVFDWSFYSQGVREQGTVSADAFIAAALVFFGDAPLARSAASPWDKGARLAQLVAERPTLLVLDGMEPLQHPPGPLAGQLRDPAVAALLRGLARHNPGLCLVTSRASVADLISFRDTTAPEWALQNLTTQAGVELLKTLGVHGDEAEFHRVVADVGGHAFTLYLLATYLVNAHEGDIIRRDRVEFDKAGDEIPARYAFKTINAYEKWLEASGDDGLRQLAILRLLGLFDRPADFSCLAALRRPPAISDLTESLVAINEEEWDRTLATLADTGLISVKIAHSAVDAHPIIREYFAEELQERTPKAWLSAHRRLYEHLKTSTEDKPQPTLEDLQPLYQAVAHGCQAGLQQNACREVYAKRILRGHERLSWKKLGSFGADLGAISCFFERPYTRISASLKESDQAFLLDEAALGLRALGRLTEAAEPLRAAIKMAASQTAWANVARGAGNLSELELTLGQVAAAVTDAEQSVIYSERSRDLFVSAVMQTVLADALHQAGRRDDAQRRFREAETMQAELQPEYPILYSVRGFRFCDLLLAVPEIIAGKRSVGLQSEDSPGIPSEAATRMASLQVCRTVTKRATQTLKVIEENSLSLLDSALDHLTLGRAALYAWILDRSLDNERQSAGTNLIAAVDGLRHAGTRDHLPRAFLSRAWQRFLEGKHSGTESAQSDLDEAWEIAERGPMRLHMADIHLYRARLFHGLRPYPWTSPQGDLAAARKLIEQCGYWRRKEELEDAEAAAKNW